MSSPAFEVEALRLLRIIADCLMEQTRIQKDTVAEMVDDIKVLRGELAEEDDRRDKAQGVV